jgi:hypothetical protein
MIFLGGTVGANNWRTKIVIPALIERGISKEALFDPVVEHWDKAAQTREDEAKRTADYVLFVLASPNPHSDTSNVSAYSLVEATMGLYDAPDRTVVILDTTGMPKHTAKAMRKAYNDLRRRFPEAALFDKYEDAIDYLVVKQA